MRHPSFDYVSVTKTIPYVTGFSGEPCVVPSVVSPESKVETVIETRGNRFRTFEDTQLKKWAFYASYVFGCCR